MGLDREVTALLAQNVCGAFVAALDEPVRWEASNAEALLDYIFEHLRMVAANDALCAQLDRPREEVLGRTPSQQWGGDPVRWRAYIRELYAQGRVRHTVRTPRRDGSFVEVEAEYICMYDAEGRITGHYGITRDLGEERTIAAALAASQERLELAVVGAGIGIWDVDVARRLVVFDPAWLERFGYTDGAIWRSWDWWLSVIHPEDIAATQRTFGDHLAGKSPMYRGEYRMRSASGEWSWILSTGKITARDAVGSAVRVVGICVDITERKRLDERLVASERLVALGTLAASVGHEINNPLTYVGLNLALIAREVEARGFHEIREMLAEARDGAERVGVIVRDLQALTRRPDERLTIVDPIAIVERCLQIADHEIRHRAQVIRAFGATPRVHGAEGRLVQLVLNLIVNAAQAIPVGAADRHWIRVASATAPDGRALVEVSDNGAGIAAGDLGRIFDPFFTTKATGAGTGLGLAISRSIAAAMGGDIEVESALGRGTTFRVLLPGSPPAEPGAALAPPGPIAGLRVLVIDDEPVIGAVIARVLQDCDVVVETSARAALARLRAGETFDRILCDLMMPDVTGMEFYEGVAAELRPRIVFLTGGAFTERARHFLESVPNRRLDKPFDVDRLAAAVG